MYDEPRHLVAAGLATASEEHTGKRPRTVFAITEAGRTRLGEWLGEPPAPPSLEFEAMIKVFFADSGTLDQLTTTLERVVADAEARVAELRTMIRAGSGESYEFAGRWPINALALRFQLDHEALLARWAQWAGREVRGWASPTDAGSWDWAAALAPDTVDGPFGDDVRPGVGDGIDQIAPGVMS